jgi:hypothetical protein
VHVATTARPAQDETAAFGHELESEVASEELEADAALKGEVELLDGAEKREAPLWTARTMHICAPCVTSSAISTARYSR